MINSHPYGITRIDADYVMPGLASVYLMRQGDRLAIVETGAAATVTNILSEIERQGLTPEHVDFIILTHIHLDHAAGAGELMRLCPSAKLLVHPRGARHMISPGKLEAGTRAVYGDEKYDELYGALVPVEAERVIETPEGFSMDFNGRTLSFLDTPGHALHHVAIHDSLSNGVFTGDTFGLSYRQFDNEAGGYLLFVTTTPVHFDPDAMRISIQRIAALKPDTVFFTHYDAVPYSDEMVSELEASLDAFVAIARSVRASGADRETEIAEKILTWLMEKAQALKPEMAEASIRRLLAMDARLNAQGIVVWLDRMSGR